MRNALAALTLALGIAASTAIFSFVNPMLLHPFTYPHADRLVSIQERDPRGNATPVSYPALRDWSTRESVLPEVAAFDIGFFYLTGVEEPEQIAGALATQNLFRVLGVAPALGRDFRDGEEGVAILTDAAWKRRFGGDPNILGHSIALDFARTPEIERYTVIGVMPPDFWMYYRGFEVFVPLAHSVIREDRKARTLYAIGRLGDASVEQARSALSVLPAEKDWGVFVRPWERTATQPVRTELLVLAGAAVLVLLIASANVAGLLLVRAQSRRRELAIRAALGASPARLARMLLGESLRLAVFAAAAGVLLAWWSVRAMVALTPPDLAAMRFVPGMDRIAVDLSAMLFAIGIAILACLLAGAFPAFQARNPAHPRNQSQWPRTALVTVEVALSVMLLAGAGLLLKTVERIRAIDPGFHADHLLVLRVPAPGGRAADPSHTAAYLQELEARVSALPGVRSVALTNAQPLTGAHRRERIEIPGRDDRIEVDYRVVSPGYFKTLGIPLRRGRFFDNHDEHKAVISETLARRYWPNDDPIGRELRAAGTVFEITGVAGDTRSALLSDPEPILYRPLRDEAAGAGQMAVRTSGDPLALARAVNGVVRDLGGVVAEVGTMESFVENDSWQQQQSAGLLGVFSALALTLTTVGLYGVISFAIGRRTREIGIRVAIGARRGDVIGLVMRESLRPVLAGLALGLMAALAMSRLLAGLLYQVAPADPLVLASVACAVAIAAAVACWLPIRRALRVDPMVALRVE